MYKSLRSNWFMILGRCTLIATIWLGVLLGLYELHYASQQEHDVDAELRRLALYGILKRINQ